MTYIHKTCPAGIGKKQKPNLNHVRVRGSRNSSDKGAQLRGCMTLWFNHARDVDDIIINIASIHPCMSTHLHESEQSEQIQREREQC